MNYIKYESKSVHIFSAWLIVDLCTIIEHQYAYLTENTAEAVY
ncbi:hypothetical protein QSI_2687 [Clostridioides difficile P28]|nr:hypothetical protein QSI_2687 [Clostridioides difficile P28]